MGGVTFTVVRCGSWCGAFERVLIYHGSLISCRVIVLLYREEKSIFPLLPRQGHSADKRLLPPFKALVPERTRRS